MSEKHELSKRIQEVLDATDDRIERMKSEATQDSEEFRERHEQFLGIAEQLIAEAGYPLKTVESHFENATVMKSDDLEGFHARCLFEHTPRFPASVELRFDITYDEEVRKIILTKTVRILPVFMEYDRTGRFVLDLESGDRGEAVRWIQDQVVSFVQTYLKIQFVKQYRAQV
jgi:hypothetical protein